MLMGRYVARKRRSRSEESANLLWFAHTEVATRFRDEEKMLLLTLERAYWRYEADLYRRRGWMRPMVSLQDLLPYLKEEASKLGVEVPRDLAELFRILKDAEAKERELVYKLWESEFVPREEATFHIAIPAFLGEEVPIPIRFYRPRLVDPRDFGIDTESSYWKTFWGTSPEPFWKQYPPIYEALIRKEEEWYDYFYSH